MIELVGGKCMEKRDFRIAKATRLDLQLQEPVFTTDEDLSQLYREALTVSYRYNEKARSEGRSDFVSASKLNATAVLHLLYQTVLTACMKSGHLDFFSRRIQAVNANDELKRALSYYGDNYPSPLLDSEKAEGLYRDTETARGFFVYQVMLNNPALVKASKPFILPEGFEIPSSFMALSSILSSYIKDESRNGKALEDEDIFTFLTKPARLYPDSLQEQIRYIMKEWAYMLPAELIELLQLSLDYIREEEKDRGTPGGAPGPMPVTDYSGEAYEYEAFSDDSNWMPRVVMMAKCTLVWLDQLSKEYGKEIRTLDQIPDRELDLLKERGFTALWLIGLWERSSASKTIKNLCGNPDAEASAYSLRDYDIAEAIGGWAALENLRQRCNARGIRLASDMVPNHTGIDGNWVYEHPDYFISQDWPPFPSYTYNGPDLSRDPNYEVKLEDHYFDRTDAAVTFRLTDKRTGQVRYVFHGNDGTTMPWNDTAQLDYLNPETREAVIQKIIHVAKNFQIIRFDAAMTLAKRHIQRLWYPKPGSAGDIAGRAVHAMSDKEFNRRIPNEFWREVVDRIAVEVPDTLLLAEAFWMMEGYFVRTLGMHRVYNSAFMNMLKNQENQKYRLGIKNTLIFEPEILKRYVNFMNNPDEETAIAQFGDGDRYFGVCTLLATLPGLPMIGHGQIEGFREKYGMEYKRAYWNETPNGWLIDQHYKRIFPLFRRRYLFSNVDHFNLYDCYNNGNVEESVFAYVNGSGNERTLVLYNNRYERVWGNIKVSCEKLRKKGDEKSTVRVHLAENLGLSFKGRKYAIMECFSDGLTYIRPSMKLYEEGLNFALNGYESKVYWNIREVEDTDGSYEILWKEYGERGHRNLRIAILMIRLKNLFTLYEPLRSRKLLDGLAELTAGKGSTIGERTLLLQLAEIYSKLPEIYENLDDVAKDILGDLDDVDAKKMVGDVKMLSHLFKKETADAFNSWAGFEKSLPLMMAISLALKPFTTGDTILEAMEKADNLPLSFFFEEEEKKLGLDENNARLICHAAAIFLNARNMVDKKDLDDSSSILAKLFKDEGIRDFAGLNEYEEITWYNKEKVQMIILLSALSIAIRYENNGFDADKYVKELLEKEIGSKYRLKELLK